MATKQNPVNLMFQNNSEIIMAVMSIAYIVFGFLFYYTDAPVIFPIIMPVLGFFTIWGSLLEFYDVSLKIGSNEMSIGIFFCYPAILYHVSSQIQIPKVLSMIPDHRPSHYNIMGHNLVAIRSISRRFRRACFVPVNAKVDGCKNTICNENYKNGVLETDESSAREVLITLIATFIVTLLWNGMCLAIIIKVCQAARNKRKGCSPLLPMDADTDAQDADITVKKTTKPRWGPETTRANYCYLVALTFCLMKLFVRQ